MRPAHEHVILVTGATDGIGRQTAHDLAARGTTVLLHGRSRERAVATLGAIRKATGNDRLRYYVADLAVLDEVRRLAGEIERDYDRFDVLINNAGIGAGKRTDRREVSRDGYELRFAVNYLAPFLLTHLLLPLLHRSAPSRIVNVASAAQHPIDFNDVMLKRHYEPWRAYSQSKLALVMFTFELAERLAGTGVTVNCLHPGSLLDTKMVRETFGRAWGSVQSGADAVVYLATSPALDGVTGRYFDQQREARAEPQAYDREARRRLWRLSEELTGLGAEQALHH